MKPSRKTQYRTVDTSTLRGLKTAERLHQNGWEQLCVRFSSTQFRKLPNRPAVRVCVDCGAPADLMTLGGHDLCRPCNKTRWEASIAIPSDPFATAEPCWKGAGNAY